MDTWKSLVKVIITKQIRFLGNWLWKNELEAMSLTEKIDGKQSKRKTGEDVVGLVNSCMWLSVD